MPYPGLRPFRRKEADLFFGREEQVERLLEMLAQKRFLAVIGPSGCGKSSLVAAGLIPALELGLLKNAGEYWKIAQMRPGSDPLKNLARKLLDAEAFGDARGKDEQSLAFLRATLQRGPRGLAEALAETPLPENHSLLIIADQFEEIFRYRSQVINEAEAFTDLLLACAELENVYVILTMRSDFLGECALFPGLPEAMNQSQFLTPRLTREQRRGAITGPAAMFDGNVEPALVNRLLNDMAAEDTDQLPVLQHCLMRMWTQKGQSRGTVLTVQDYEAAGTMTQALSNHADDAYAELGEEEKAVAEVMFRCLCDYAGAGRDTRRPAALSEIADVCGKSIQTLAPVVQTFQKNDRCFLFKNADGITDISHESLIRQWETLRKWAKEEAESADKYRRLEQTAQLWKKGEAGLLISPELDMALKWKEKQKPVKQWAARYGDHFDLAMEFLNASEVKQKKDEEEKKREFQERTLHLFNTYLTHASLLVKMEDYAAARKILEQSRELDKEIPATRRHARNLLAWFTDLMGGTAEKVYQGADVPLFNVAISPDGKILAAVGEKGTVVLFDAESGEIIRRLEGHEKDVGQQGAVRAAVFHPDGKWLVTAGDDSRIIFWSVPDGEKLREIQAPGKIWEMALSTDGKVLASGGTDNDVTLWNAESGKKIRTMQGHGDSIKNLAFHPDGTLLASASLDHTAIIWDVKTGKSIHTLRRHTNQVLNVAFHPDGNILATCGSDRNIILWESESGRPMAVLQGHENLILGLAFTPSGDRLISGSFDRTIRVWDTETGVTLRVLQGHEAGVVRLAVKGNHIFSAANDMTVRRWEIPSLSLQQNIPLPLWDGLGEGEKQQPETKDGFHPPPTPPSREGSFYSMLIADMPSEPASSAISPDGSFVAVGFANGGLCLYSLPEVQQIWEVSEAHSKDTQRMTFSPDGKHLATASFDNTAKLWQVSDGKLLQTFTGHTNAVHGIAFSPDGSRIGTASYDGRIGLFDIRTGKGQFHEAHEGIDINSVEFDSGGEKLLSSSDQNVRLWDIRQWPPALLQDFPKSADNIMWAAISPDGSRVARVGRDFIVHIFSTKDGTETQRLVGHENIVFRVTFSPDSGQIATVSADATVRFWDLETGECLFTLQLPAPPSPYPVRLWDFTFRCTPTGCWLAVPLTRGKLVVYHMGMIYD